MDRKPRWRDRVKSTPYISPFQSPSSTGLYQDMNTKLDVIKLHYTVRQQMGYGETSVNKTREKLEDEEEESLSKNKSRGIEDGNNSGNVGIILTDGKDHFDEEEVLSSTKSYNTQHMNNSLPIVNSDDVSMRENKSTTIKDDNNSEMEGIVQEDGNQLVIEEERLSSTKSYNINQFGNLEQIFNLQTEEIADSEPNEEKDNTNNSDQPDGIDCSMDKLKQETQAKITPLDSDHMMNLTTEISPNIKSLSVNDINQAIFHEESRDKFNESDDYTTIDKNKFGDQNQGDEQENINRKAEDLKEPHRNEINLEDEYQISNKFNQNPNEAINPQLIVANDYVDSEDSNNLSKIRNKNNGILSNKEIYQTNETQGIESITLLKKLVSDEKRQKEMKLSEVNKLTACLFIMFILSGVFYFMFSRENSILKDDLSKSFSQKAELENLIAESLSELNILQHKLDETISQRDFFHLKLNEALLMQGKESEIKEIQDRIQLAEDDPPSWFSLLGSFLYGIFYFIFRRLILAGSFIILAIAGDKLTQDYFSIDISSESVNKSISMAICFLILYELCGIVTLITTIPLVSSPLFNWYQPDNLFMAGSLKMLFSWSFANGNFMKWLSTAMVGLIVLVLCVYIMSEISKTMKSHGVDKQNHDAFFIITWPLLAVAVSVFLAWLSVLPLT